MPATRPCMMGVVLLSIASTLWLVLNPSTPFAPAPSRAPSTPRASSSRPSFFNNNNNGLRPYSSEAGFSQGPTTRPSALSFLRPGIAASSITQIHHGIYKIVSSRDHDQRFFALKTECRPVNRWHGQQGWSEVAIFELDRLLQLFPQPLVPAARGAVVGLAPEQVRLIHSDWCGLAFLPPTVHSPKPPSRGRPAPTSAEEWSQLQTALVADAPAAWRRLPADLRLDLAPAIASSTVPLIGVALEWRPTHDDDALKTVIGKRRLGRAWELGSFQHDGGQGTGGTGLSKGDWVLVGQLSDVFVLDYLVENEDREDKNWFTVQQQLGGDGAAGQLQFVAMDNGWGFAGRHYKGSVCDTDSSNLRCPPLLRFVGGRSAVCILPSAGGWSASKLKKPPSSSSVNCRFRRRTIDRLRQLVALSGGGADRRRPFDALREEWTRRLLADPLFAWLGKTYGSHIETKPKGLRFSVALARYVQGCPGADEEGHDSVVTTETLARWLAIGVEARINALLTHVDRCVESYGAAAVLLEV